MKILAQKTKILGLDVNSSSLKLAELSLQGKSLKVQALSKALLPKGLVINDAISDTKIFAHLLEEALRKPKFGRFTTNTAAVSIPESKAFVRVIQVPQLSEKEMDSAVRFEAESFIPMPLEQVCLDWQPLGTSDGKANVLIIASPNDYVEKYLSVLDQSGIVVKFLEADSQSCHRCLISGDAKDNMLIVDIQSVATNLIMIQDGHLQFTSSVPIAGNAFTDAVAKVLGVAFAKAEEIKQAVGIANTSDYPNVKIALLPVLSGLAAEIKSILKFHHEHYSQNRVEKIVLCGGGARLKNLDTYLAAELSEIPGLKTELADPWVGFVQTQGLPLTREQALEFVPALGLALRGF